MTTSSGSGKSSSTFPAVTKKNWTDAALQELGAGNSVEQLIKTTDGLQIQPYYHVNDASSVDIFRIPFTGISHDGDRNDAHEWLNAPNVDVTDAVTANKLALHLLNQGANAILFNILAEVDISILLSDIELQYCGVFFSLSSSQKGMVHDFFEFIKSKKIPTRDLTCAFFWIDDANYVASLPFPIAGIKSPQTNDPIQAIATLLAKAIKQIDRFTENGVEVRSALNATAFSIPITSDFFFEIARLKALRFLWYQITQSYQPGFDAEILIHAHVDSQARYEPHGDLLENTAGALSAILGGANILTLARAADDSVVGRAARSIPIILKEEVHLAKVADPTSGSYYLQRLTDEIAVKVWTQMQAFLQK
jgi:methylmalonyl-CoA mutase